MTGGSRRRRRERTEPDDRNSFTGVKVFSATGSDERCELGDKVTAWLAASAHLRIVDAVVLQSSDDSHHCLSVTLFYVDESAANDGGGGGANDGDADG
jgi:hypothetical protein